MPERASRCSAKSPIAFVWAGNFSFSGETQIDRAVQAFSYVLLLDPSLVWDSNHLGITRQEFRNRVARASNGRLIPVSQVAEIDRAASEFLFEIKYDFNVVFLDGEGNRATRKMRTRFYISEPPTFPNHFVGLHVHEKQIFPNDHSLENAMQNTEIDLAVKYYEAGRGDEWGIAP